MRTLRSGHSPLPGTIAEDPLQTAPLTTRDRRVRQGTPSAIARIGQRTRLLLSPASAEIRV
ncbi:hypothetical protein [Nocardia vaccinii]|uniref:hypothetical protein n=1 Tax=Nocardia vaccinii TaxID=1822 RepID=UPI0012F4CFC9|nr:hypothetical protein [Nocardia vaccinii]